MAENEWHRMLSNRSCHIKKWISVVARRVVNRKRLGAISIWAPRYKCDMQRKIMRSWRNANLGLRASHEMRFSSSWHNIAHVSIKQLLTIGPIRCMYIFICPKYSRAEENLITYGLREVQRLIVIYASTNFIGKIHSLSKPIEIDRQVLHSPLAIPARS